MLIRMEKEKESRGIERSVQNVILDELLKLGIPRAALTVAHGMLINASYVIAEKKVTDNLSDVEIRALNQFLDSIECSRLLILQCPSDKGTVGNQCFSDIEINDLNKKDFGLLEAAINLMDHSLMNMNGRTLDDEEYEGINRILNSIKSWVGFIRKTFIPGNIAKDDFSGPRSLSACQ